MNTDGKNRNPQIMLVAIKENIWMIRKNICFFWVFCDGTLFATVVTATCRLENRASFLHKTILIKIGFSIDDFRKFNCVWLQTVFTLCASRSTWVFDLQCPRTKETLQAIDVRCPKKQYKLHGNRGRMPQGRRCLDGRERMVAKIKNNKNS